MQISPIFSKIKAGTTEYRIKKEFHDMYESEIPTLYIYVRIDSRIVRGHGYEYKYAPITSKGFIDYANSFWDSFEEMEEMPKTYTESL